MKIYFPATITIAAPAAKVWHVIAHEFADIGRWASAIPRSAALTDLPSPAHAVVGGRACQAAIPGFSTVHEQFTYYEEDAMRFGYAAVAGLPGLIRRAENHWAVHAQSPTQSQVKIRGELEVPKYLGLLVAPLLKWQIGRAGQFTLEELKYYIEMGKPHPRKAHSR
ncbi:MAG: SRPBCC family protein [Caldilineaceae bacterium]